MIKDKLMLMIYTLEERQRVNPSPLINEFMDSLKELLDEEEEDENNAH